MICQERVQLRPVDLSDATAIQRWYAEPQVVEYAIIQPFLGYSPNEVEDLIKRWLGRDDRKLYVVRATEQNRDAGLVFLEHIDWKNRLDEPTASLDPKEEAHLYGRFAELAQGKTVLLITHRLASVQMADRILVLREGRLVEEGSHQALLRHNGVYAELWRLQAEGYRVN
ncbi:GNAT family N-acetyltransferase [Calidithermus terrae]